MFIFLTPRWSESISFLRDANDSFNACLEHKNFSMPGIQLHYIFETIGREYNKDAQKTTRTLVKESSASTQFYYRLNFNHTCLRDNLLHKSLKFSPPIRTSRG